MKRALTTGQYLGKKEYQFRYSNGIIVTQSDYTPDQVLPLHYHENIILGYVLKGQYTETVGNETKNCPKGALIVQLPQTEHQNLISKCSCTCFNIELSSSWSERLLLKSLYLPDWIVCQHSYFSSVIFRMIREINNSDNLTELITESMVIDLLVNVARFNGDSKSIRIPKKLKAIKDKLDAEFYLNHTLKELGDGSGMDSLFLARQFKQYFHCSIGEYIRQIRIEKACLLLKNSAASVSAISHECGFSDASHLIRHFKNNMQVTPKTYRDCT